MAARDSNIEANASKRIRMNITMSIEVNKDESGKEYQDLVKNVTREAMTRIDAALTGTNSNNKTIKNQPTDTKITRLEKSDYKNPEDNKSNENSTLNTNTVVETEAMKQIRLRLELKKKSKQKPNDVTNDTTSVIVNSPNTNGSRENVLPETKNAKVSKRKLNCTTDDKDKNKINETEAMKRIRQSLELKKKSDQNQNAKTITGAILSSPNTSGSCGNVILETEMAKVSKVKTYGTINDGDKGKTKETKAMKRARQYLELKKKLEQNLNASPRAKTSSLIRPNNISGTCESVVTETKNAKGSKRATKCTTDGEDENKNNETEAMKRIRQSLELKKKLDQNRKAETTTGAILSSSDTSGGCENVLPETKNANSKRTTKFTTNDEDKNKNDETEAMKRVRLSLELKMKSKRNQNDVANATGSSISESVFPGTSNTASSQGIKRKIANVDIHKPETEKIKRIKLKKAQIENNYASTSTNTAEITKSYSTTRDTPRNTTTINIEYNSVTKPNHTPNEFYEITEDESEIEMSDSMSETNTGSVEDNRIDSKISSTSRHYSARSVGGPEDIAAAVSSGRRTRSKTAWERKLWTK